MTNSQYLFGTDTHLALFEDYFTHSGDNAGCTVIADG